METRLVKLPLGPDREISVVLFHPPQPIRNAVLILGHGANNTMDHPLLVGVCERLTKEGVVTVRFNFPYAEEGKSRPDPEPVLEGAWRLVVGYVSELKEYKGMALYLGGKSMGARLVAQVVAQDVAASGLVFLGYPLHPPGRPESLRDRALYALACPVLFIQGTRDPFCQLARLGEVLSRIPVRCDIHLLPGRGHSFEDHTGEPPGRILDQVSRVILGWLDSL